MTDTNIHNIRHWIVYDRTTGAIKGSVSGNGLSPTGDPSDPVAFLEGALPPGHWKINLADLTLVSTDPPPEPYYMGRSREYPGWQDFADAFYWAQQGDPSKMNDYLAKIGAVKKKYPKPTI